MQIFIVNHGIDESKRERKGKKTNEGGRQGKRRRERWVEGLKGRRGVEGEKIGRAHV